MQSTCSGSPRVCAMGQHRSAVALLPGGGVARLVKKPVAVDALAAGGERDFVLRRSPTQLFGGGDNGRKARGSVADSDAAILFSDILVVAQAVGVEVTMPGGVGIQVPKPLQSPADMATLALENIDVKDKLGHVLESVGGIVGALEAERPEGVRACVKGSIGVKWKVSPRRWR